MISLVDSNFADEFFDGMPENKIWSLADVATKAGALKKASLQISNLKFKEYKFLEKPLPDKFKYAVCYQAFYLLANDERISHLLNNMNGIQQINIQLFSVVQGKAKEFYPEVWPLLNPYLMRAGRFR